ncbi:MAG TPA: hypothetical protein VKT73_11240 [Xanthobacteraceae bacterium]|nr:hypothetical protein [Xanthobacteraceae bacterium]
MAVDIAGRLMRETRIGGFLLALLLSASPAASAEKPKLYTNESYVEDVNNRASLPIGDAKAMFAWVLGELPDRVKVYPTENYYYFYFYHQGSRYAGNIRLDAATRDEGKVNFAYYVDMNEWHLKEDNRQYVVLGKDDGVAVEKVAPLLYRVSYGDKHVLFELNDLSGVKPPAGVLGADEKFLGPIMDESGVRFFLVFNEKLKIFHYILDETVPLADELFPTKKTPRILIGRRTGFAFYQDQRLPRKIMIAAFEANVHVNNYFDGPFDQLPDNFIVGDELRNAILAESPELKDEGMDRFGHTPDGSIRYLIGPYIFYRKEEDLYQFDACATSKKVPHDEYYRCFVADPEEENGPRIPLPFLKDKGRR